MRVESTGASCPCGPSPAHVGTNPGSSKPRRRSEKQSCELRSVPQPSTYPDGAPHEPRTAPLTDASNIDRPPLACDSRSTSRPGPHHLVRLACRAPADDPLKPGQAHPYPCERHQCLFIHAKARRPFSLPSTTVGGILTYTAIPQRVSTAKFHLSSTCWRTRPSTRSHTDMIPTAYRIALLPHVGEPSESGRARTASPTVAKRGSGTTPATKLACTNIRG